MAGRVNSVVREQRTSQVLFFVLFLIGGVAIFVFGSNYFTVFPTNENLAYRPVLSVRFLVLAVWLKHMNARPSTVKSHLPFSSPRSSFFSRRSSAI